MIKHSKIKHHIYLSMMNGYLSNELYLTLEQYITEQEKKEELLEEYIHAFNIFTKRNEITIKFEDNITLNEIFRNIKVLEEELK